MYTLAARFPPLQALWLVLSLLLLAQPAQAQRVALIIGNANYSQGRLTNPPNDVAAMEAALKRLNFKVQTVHNANQNQMKRAVRDFGASAQGAEVAFMYYSGHGTQANGENYLLPVGAAIDKESDYEVEAVSANAVLRQIQGARPKAAILVLDACRDNPLAATTRSASKGLGRMDAPTGTMIAFATAPNNVASDNGDYAKVLAKELQKPGQELIDVFRNTTAEVRRLSAGKQEPRISEMSISERLYLAGQGTQVASLSPEPTGRPNQSDPEEDAWQATKAANSAAAYDAYLAEYPRGRYAGAARIGRVASQAGTGQPVQRVQAEPPRPAQTAPATAGQVIKDCDVCPELVVIPAGSFTMGSPNSEAGRFDDEGPQHRVDVKNFLLGKTEVTVAQFRRFVQAKSYRTDAEQDAGGNPGCQAWDASDGKFEWRAGRYWREPGWAIKDNEPVSCISWNDATAYVDWISQTTGKQYRLPSEAEWEYAARAGSTTARYWGEDADEACAYANGADQTKSPGGLGWNNKQNCSDGYWFVAPVANYRPNAFGLYDMLGNVSEWTQDVAHSNYAGAPSDGSAWTTGRADTAPRVLRGGGWHSLARYLRSADRIWDRSDFRTTSTGLRIASQ